MEPELVLESVPLLLLLLVVVVQGRAWVQVWPERLAHLWSWFDLHRLVLVWVLATVLVWVLATVLVWVLATVLVWVLVLVLVWALDLELGLGLA
jgi:hypothetical protein